MFKSMPRKWVTRAGIALTILACVFLIGVGFMPDGLPFIPGAQFSDAATSHLPAAQHLRESFWVDEAFPVWRESMMAGQPFAANPLNKTAYPLQWLVLFLPPPLHINIMIVLHVLIAGLGMWRWVRALGLRREAAAVSALMWMLTPRLLAHLGAGHLDIVYALARLPWVMESVQKRRVFMIGVTASLLVISDVRIALYGLALAGVYAIGLFFQLSSRQERHAIKHIGGLIAAGLITFALTIGIILPLLEWSPYLTRAALTQADAGIFSLELGHLIGVLFPAQQSNPETVTMLGLPALILAGIGVLSAPRKHTFWIAVMIGAGWYALGANGGLWTLLTSIFPMLLWFRVPSRAWIIVALIVVMLAGYGVNWLFAHQSRIKHRFHTLHLILIAAFGVSGIFTLLSLPVPDTVGLSLLIGGAGTAVVVLIAGQAKVHSTRTIVGALLALVLLDGLLIGRNWIEWRGADDWFDPYVPLTLRLVELGADRVYAPTYSLPQNVSQFAGVSLFGGVDPFQVRAVTQAINAAGGVSDTGYGVVAPALNGVTGDDLTTANQGAQLDTDQLAAWRVSHVIAPYTIEQADFELIDTIDGVNIYANLSYQALGHVDERVPDWVNISEPNAAQVAILNEHTVNAQLFSLAGFAGCGLIGVLSLIRRKRK